MINSKQTVGTRLGRPFIQGVKLVPTITESLKEWVLRNDNVSFTFKEDKDTGVCLYKWSHNSFVEEVFNKARSLWQLNMIRSYDTNDHSGSMYVNRYDVNPSYYNFVAPKTYPTVSDRGSSFTFVWDNIKYDTRFPTLTAKVTVVAFLPAGSDALDISISIRANQSYSRAILERASTVSAVQMPALAFAKLSDETKNENTIFSIPVGWGHTFSNPTKYLRTPRFLKESVQYSNYGERTYHGGQSIGTSPVASLKRANYGSPGWMTVPALVFGRKDNKEGTLIYLLDSDGKSAKGFQWYCDDRNLHISTYDVSDYELDPYGIGGRYHVNQTFNTINDIKFSLRLRPFVTSSSWVDWEGYRLYKEEVVPEQQVLGYIPKSFYERYELGETSLQTSELPIMLNTFGQTTGDATAINTAATFYQDLYKNSVNPSLTYTPAIPIHIQSVSLNSAPLMGTGQYTASNNYYGWEPWAGKTVGTNWGPEAFKSPDFTGINSVFAPVFNNGVTSSQLLYPYLVFPFHLSTGSEWVRIHSGIDLVSKEIGLESKTITNDDYRRYAYSGGTLGFYTTNFPVCLGVDVAYEKFIDIAEVMSSSHAGAYHDTLGNWGRGCYAHEHTYYDPNSRRLKTVTHPRGKFTSYFIDKQLKWLSGWRDTASAFISDDWIGSASDSGYLYNQSSEFPCDIQLKYVPTSLIYDVQQPILQTFYNEIGNPRPDMLNNTYLGVDVDALSDATISAVLAADPTIKYWQGACQPPMWLQRCPAYQIIHSDKAVLNEWAVPHVTNVNYLYYTVGEFTGVGTYNQILKNTNTEDHRKLDWGAWGVMQWGYLNRLSPWSPSPDYGIINSGYSYIQPEATALYSGVWSGHTEGFVEKTFRLQAYCPDYVYHGTLLHPLESFDVDYSTDHSISIGIKTSRHPHTLSTTGTYLGDPKIAHSLRKHREYNSVLFTANNWFSGTTAFTGTFDPNAYGINSSYQVYSLDVNSSNHGTRTLLSLLSSGASYDFTLNLDQYEMAVYEFVDNSVTLDNTVFADLKTNYSNIRYAYDVYGLSTRDLSLTYSYGSSAYGEIDPPMEGFKAPSTQNILNNLPQWMQIRQDTTSRGWKLTNSWGMALDNVLENVNKRLYDLNLSTADTTYVNKLYSTEVTSKELLTEKTYRNLLYNSAFSIRDVARTHLPAGWESYQNSNDLVLDYTVQSPGVVALKSTSGSMKIGQQVILDNVLINNLNNSVYIKCNASTVNVILHVSIEKMDGTSVSANAKLINRSSEWVRLVLPLEINDQVYRINYSITADCSGEVLVSAPQIEVDSISNWSNNILDYIPFYASIPFGNAIYAVPQDIALPRIPLYPINEEDIFLDIGIPTRVNKTVSPNYTLAPFATQAYGRKVDQLKEITNTEWVVLEEQVVERSLSPTVWDIYGRYDIRDLRYFEDLEYGTRENTTNTITPLATAIRKEWLFVACKEVYEGKTLRTLKIIRPKTPPNGETYLESVIDFDLDLSFESYLGSNQTVDEEITSIGFSEIDTSWLVINTSSNRRFFYKMYFDYYFFDYNNNRLYTLEKYNNAKLAII